MQSTCTCMYMLCTFSFCCILLHVHVHVEMFWTLCKEEAVFVLADSVCTSPLSPFVCGGGGSLRLGHDVIASPYVCNGTVI